MASFRWIPVKKAKPDDETTVLVCVAGNDDMTTIAFLDGEVWREAASAGRLKPQPTHWAELPKAPN